MKVLQVLVILILLSLCGCASTGIEFGQLSDESKVSYPSEPNVWEHQPAHWVKTADEKRE